MEVMLQAAGAPARDSFRFFKTIAYIYCVSVSTAPSDVILHEKAATLPQLRFLVDSKFVDKTHLLLESVHESGRQRAGRVLPIVQSALKTLRRIPLWLAFSAGRLRRVAERHA